MQGMTIMDAVHEWVAEMNAYPLDMIRTLVQAEPDNWREVTMPRVGDRVCLYDIPDKDSEGKQYDGTDYSGEIMGLPDGYGGYAVKLDDGTWVRAGADEMEIKRDDYFPAWGKMWSFGDSADDYWLKEMGGIAKMSQCGFRIYENEEWGYFFGIDGAGYDFYSEHWAPLYKARGMKWHEEVTMK